MTEREGALVEIGLGVLGVAALYELSLGAFGKKLKREIREEQHFVCDNCHEVDPRLEIHHIRPQSLGGSDNPENAVGLCGPHVNDCHEKYDRLALDQHVLYDGEVLDIPYKKKSKHKKSRFPFKIRRHR